MCSSSSRASGTASTPPQPGHLTRLPDNSSLTLRLLPHGHGRVMLMGLHRFAGKEVGGLTRAARPEKTARVLAAEAGRGKRTNAEARPSVGAGPARSSS